MVTQYIARKDGSWNVISTAPDVCKTPLGPATPPIPYPVIANMDTAVGVVSSVKANVRPVLVLEQSVIPTTQGDAPGTARGIKSGTVGDICEPLEHSKTVFAGGKQVLRHGDAFWMNARNTTGIIVGQPPTPDVPVDEANPPVEPENEDERQFMSMLRQAYASQAEADQQTAMAMKALAERVAAFFSDHTADGVINSAATGGMLNAAGYYSMTPETARNIAQQIGGEAAQTFEEMDTPEVRGMMTALQGTAAAFALRQAGGIEGARVKGREKQVLSDEGSGTASATRTCAGEPVDVGSGEFIQQLSVLSLPGSLPLTLSRFYRSRAQGGGIFGKKWTDEWSISLTIRDDKLHFADEEGVELYYLIPKSGVFSSACNTRQPCYRLSGNVQESLSLFNRRTQRTHIFTHEDKGRYLLSAIEDSYGNRIEFFRTAGLLTEIAHSDGYTLALDWQNQQLVSIDLVTPEPQRLVTCCYDSNGMLSECDTFQFTHLWHEYSQDEFMTHWRDTHKTRVEIEYDKHGRAVSTCSTEGYYNDRFIYDDEQQCTLYVDAEGGETRYWYNEEGLVTRTLDPLGREETCEWDHTRLVSRTDALGRVTEFNYNEEGDVSSVAMPGAQSLSYDYSERGQLTRLAAPDGQIWLWNYDDRGSLVSLTDPQGRSQQFSYSEQGDLLRQVIPGGATWEWRYDALHQVRKHVAPDGGITQTERDMLGRLLSVKDPLGYTTQFRHSKAHAGSWGSVEDIHRPDGVRELRSWNSEKRPECITDGEGKTTGYEYGAFDLLTAIVRPDGERLACRYDKLTRLTEIINAEGESYRLAYDKAGQLIAETDFTGRTLTYRYDAAGRCIRTTFPDGTHLNREFNVTDRVIRETVIQSGSEKIAATTTFSYDVYSRLTAARNDDATVTFEYDDAGKLIAETSNGRRTEYYYDAERDYVTQRTTGNVTEKFVRGVMGELTSWQLADHPPLLFTHDLRGQETARRSDAGFHLRHAYTATGMLSEQQCGDQQAFRHSHALHRQWYYDRAYNLTMLADARRGTMTGTLTANDQFSHAAWSDSRAAPVREERFTYDKNQNITSRQGWFSGVMESESRQRQQHGRVVSRGDREWRHTAHRIHPESGMPERGSFVQVIRDELTSWQYDLNGRLAEKRTERQGGRAQQWRYRWDARSQLTGLEKPDGERWEYKYDPFGRRISKRCVNRDKAGMDFHWNGDLMVGEVPVSADGTPQENKEVRWYYVPGSFTPLARYENGELHYAVADTVGRVQELVKEDGEIVWRGEQQLWGRETGFQREGVPGCRLRFAGQYEDEESGLYYNRHRYYDCVTGQYLSADPVGLAGGLNLYAYAPNPLSWIDPLGLCKGEVTGEYSAINTGPLSDDLAGTFAGGKYRGIILSKDTELYRAGVEGRPFGQFFSLDKPQSVLQTRIDKAVLPNWPGGGTSPLDSVFKLKIPAGTKVYVGDVGYQNGIYLGGTQQIVIPKSWDIPSVQVLEQGPLL